MNSLYSKGKIMKKFLLPFLAAAMSLCNLQTFSQAKDQPKNQPKEDTTALLGLAGDNLDLYAVLDVFQKSKTIEEFEKSLNDEKAKIKFFHYCQSRVYWRKPCYCECTGNYYGGRSICSNRTVRLFTSLCTVCSTLLLWIPSALVWICNSYGSWHISE